MPATPAMPQSAVPPAPPAGRASGAPPPADPVYAGKNAFIEKHRLVVFRLTQHWNRRTPDPRAQGLANAMGWTKYQAGGDALRYALPGMTLDALASQLKKTLGTRGGIRAIGDRAMPVRTIGLLPGYSLIQAAVAMMPNVDAIVAGEVQEWESAAYAQDVAFAGVDAGLEPAEAADPDHVDAMCRRELPDRRIPHVTRRREPGNQDDVGSLAGHRNSEPRRLRRERFMCRRTQNRRQQHRHRQAHCLSHAL